MNRFVRRSWWKVLAVLLVLYGIIAGMLIPLKPNLVSVAPRTAELGQVAQFEITGYNTTLGADAGAVKAWIRAGESHAIAATVVEVKDDRRAVLTFRLPDYLPEVAAGKSKTYPLIISSPADGAFVDAVGISFRQPEAVDDDSAAIAAWRAGAIRKGQLDATSRITFPFRGLLAESIRNTYFHVSLWFAMMFVFIAAVTYAIKFLLRSRNASIEGISVVSYRDKADYWSVAFTSVGMLFGVLGLLTGAVWAKYTWGSYWSWDIKQFTTLIALLIYAGYFVLRASFPDPEQRARLGAAYNIFAFACLIPLIYILPRLSGNSLHPGAAGNPAFGGEDLDNTMRMVFYPIIIGWTLFGFWMAGVGYRARLLKEKVLLKE